MKHSARTVIVCMSMYALVGCSNRHPSGEAQALANVSASGSVSIPSATGGGATDFRPRASISAPWRDSSALDVSTRIIAIVSCSGFGACATDPGATAAMIAAKISIVSASGEATRVEADKNGVSGLVGKTVTLPAMQYYASFVPTTPLAPDSQYLVTITSDSDAVLGFADSTSIEQNSSIASSSSAPYKQSISVFTGSAPVPTRVEVTNVTSKPVTSIRVRFSEPVLYSSISKGLVVKNAKGETLEGCVWSANLQACAPADSPEVGELFDFFLTNPTVPTTIFDGVLEVSGSVMGSGRSVADGSSIRGLKATDATGILRTTLSGEQWMSCSQQGDILCIRSLAY